MFRTKVGSLMFNVTRRVSVTGERCRDPRGCECGTSEHAQTVCSYVRCPPSNCSSPLRPQGHCCYDYCGAVITVRRMSRGLTIHTLTHLAEEHAGQHTRVYVRRMGDSEHQVTCHYGFWSLINLHLQIMMVPGPRGNLSATHQAAARIKDFLLVELKSKETEVWIEYSGAYPPPGVAGNKSTKSY